MEMEQEQEMLNASLISLTTHFAQVQFRLTQVGAASDIETKEVAAQNRDPCPVTFDF